MGNGETLFTLDIKIVPEEEFSLDASVIQNNGMYNLGLDRNGGKFDGEVIHCSNQEFNKKKTNSCLEIDFPYTSELDCEKMIGLSALFAGNPKTMEDVIKEGTYEKSGRKTR